MMLVDVGPLLRRPMGSTQTCELSEHQEHLDDLPAADVKGTVSFLRTAEGILVSARLSIASSDRCSRCLETLQTAYDIRFQEEFAPTVDIDTGSRLPLPEEDAFSIDERQVIDLDEAIRQYRIASQLMQPLCRPDCKGLCPECGINLNAAVCSCPHEEFDPHGLRASVLQEIKARIGAEERG